MGLSDPRIRHRVHGVMSCQVRHSAPTHDWRLGWRWLPGTRYGTLKRDDQHRPASEKGRLTRLDHTVVIVAPHHRTACDEDGRQ